MSRLEGRSILPICSSKEGKRPLTAAGKCACLHGDSDVTVHTSEKTALRSFMVKKTQNFSNTIFYRDCTGAFTTVQCRVSHKPMKKTWLRKPLSLCNTVKSQILIHCL